MKKAIAFPICLSLLAFVAPTALGGGAKEVTITIKNSPPAFHGKVQSSKTECEAHRSVLLYRVKSGADKVIGDDQTNGQGQWKILEDQFILKSGAYYAQAPRLGLESGVECRRDKTEKVFVK